MNRYNIICAIALTTLSFQLALAQAVDKEVTVTRAYTPTIEDATKLTLIPDTSDNSYIKPDIDYSITPISIGTAFKSDLYAPTRMSFGEYDRQERFYIKAGVGYPFNTAFDLYASSVKSSKGYIMGYLNQDGRFAKIENDYGEKNGSSQNHMRGGVAGGLYLGKQALEGSLNYDNDRWSRYATSTLYDTNPLYQDIDFDVRYGDNFLDLERLNFAIEADAKYFWSRSDFNSFKIGALGSLGYGILGGDARISLGYSYINGSGDYSDNTFFASFDYGYNNDKLAFGLGIKYYSDNIDGYTVEDTDSDDAFTGGASNYIVPNINFNYKLSTEKAILYFDVDGKLRSNDFATLSGVNPYLAPGLSLPQSSVEYNADFGLKGRIAESRLGYNLYVGFTQITNNVYWAYYELEGEDYADNYFLASYSNQHNINFNLELEYHPISNLSLQFGVSHANYNNDEDQLYADGDSNTKLRFDGEYSVAKLKFGVNVQLLSSRECSQIIMGELSTVEIPTTFDMGLSVDYRYNDKFVIFADVNNLFNSNIYNWLHYREYGINLLAGVKIQF